MYRKLFLIIALLITTHYLSQKEASQWYFGNYAAMSFNNGTPTALLNSAIVADGCCASIADSSGKLLFYSDGITVYNAHHAIMLNGTGLMGAPSSTESGIIVKNPVAKNSITFLL